MNTDAATGLATVNPAMIKPAMIKNIAAYHFVTVNDPDALAARLRARAESDRLVSEHEVYLAAVDEAGALTRQAMQETARMRKETDDYIDAKLATFEITLQKTLQTVDRGRERLRSQMYQELAPIQDQPYDDSFADTGFIDTGFIDDRR